MKKLLFIVLAVAMVGCKKGDLAATTDLAAVKVQIVGSWTGLKSQTNYTDLSGKAQVFLSPYIYSYIINANGTAKKNSRILATGQTATTFSCPYTITSVNGKNYITFLVSPDDTSDIYEIVTITPTSLILKIAYSAQSSNIVPGTNATGTNATYNEELYK